MTAASVVLCVVGCLLISSPEDFADFKKAEKEPALEDKKTAKEEVHTLLPSEKKPDPVFQALTKAPFLNLFFLLTVTNCKPWTYG
jgi:hypothetical protein